MWHSQPPITTSRSIATSLGPAPARMDRLSRFRRSKKDTAEATGVLGPEDSARPISSSRTPSPGAQQMAVQPPERRRDRHSPFRSLHFRSSAKRARSSPPAALPQSPSSALHHHRSELAELVASGSPLSTVQPASSPSSRARHPTIPSFLTLSNQDIGAKFQELVWLERERLALASQNLSPDFRWAREPHRRRLDRYMNVQPWHNNRVKLQVPAGRVDYINASPISTSQTLAGGQDEHPNRYIAMQGPKRETVEHVWRMVSEQMRSPAVIVMLTETHEGMQEKCYPYFPRTPHSPPLEIGVHDEFSDGFRASVRCEAIEPTCAGDAIELRKLVIRIHRKASTPVAREEQRRRQGERLPSANGQRSANGSAAKSTTDDSDGTDGTEIDEDDYEEDEMLTMSPIKSDSPGMAHVVPPLSRTAPPPPLLSTKRQRKPRPEGQDHDGQTGPDFTDGTGSASSSESADGEGVDEEESEDVEKRVVYHFLYKKWPDFGVPALEDLDSFFTLMRLSREKNADPDNPRIVHCSAGVGRSGTFIALEHLMRELDSGLLENFDEIAASRRPSTSAGGRNSTRSSPGAPRTTGGSESPASAATTEREEPPLDPDLIFQTVNQLREQRRTMVQADSQYLFIYQVLRKLWQDKYGIPEDEQEPAAKRLEVDPFVGHH